MMTAQKYPARGVRPSGEEATAATTGAQTAVTTGTTDTTSAAPTVTAEQMAARADYAPSADPNSDYQRERRCKMRAGWTALGVGMVLGIAAAVVTEVKRG